jgi:hypothetical protein
MYQEKEVKEQKGGNAIKKGKQNQKDVGIINDCSKF